MFKKKSLRIVSYPFEAGYEYVGEVTEKEAVDFAKSDPDILDRLFIGSYGKRKVWLNKLGVVNSSGEGYCCHDNKFLKIKRNRRWWGE
jgi:hypothetical protein